MLDDDSKSEEKNKAINLSPQRKLSHQDTGLLNIPNE